MRTFSFQICCWAAFTVYYVQPERAGTPGGPEIQGGSIVFPGETNGGGGGGGGGGPNCTHLDSCEHNNLRSRKVDSELERNCACDQECAVYGDCCHDSAWIGRQSLDDRFTCVSIENLGGFYMISRCPSNHQNSDLQEKCERGGIDSDPMGSMPVTDLTKRITYRNIFCAMCNSDSRDKTFWTPKLDCPDLNWSRHKVTLPDIRDNLIFNESLGQWTVDVTLNGVRVTKPCTITPAFPHSVVSAIRSCKPKLIQECPADWQDETIAWECLRYQGTRYDYDNGYRNVHCALCNGVTNTSSLMCSSVKTSRGYGDIDGRSSYSPSSFSILLDINMAKNGPSVGKIEPRSCPTPDQVYDMFLRSCRSIVCGFKQFQLINGRCLNKDDLERVLAVDDKTLRKDKDGENDQAGNDGDDDVVDDDQDNDILSCPKILLTRHEFILKENGEAFVPLYNRSFNSTNFQLEEDILYVCSSFLDNEVSLNKFSSEMGLVTLIGLGISIISLVLHIIAFTLVTEIRNLSGHNLVCLSISLIIAYTSFILMQSLSIKKSHRLCTLTGYSVAYFFLASMAWMNVIAWDVWRTLRMATIELRVSHGKQRGRFIIYSLYAWLISGLFVGAAILTDHLPEGYVPEDFRPGFGTSGHCWFHKRRALLLFFAAPIALTMTANLLIFILTTMMIGSTTSGTKSFNHQSGATRTNSKLYLKLWLLMGLTWIVGFIASSIESLYLWYLFIILNSLQGLFIFVAFSCKRKVLRSVKSKLSNLTSSSGSGGSYSIATLSQNQSKLSESDLYLRTNLRKLSHQR